MENSAIQSGAPSRQHIYQFAQEVVHGSIDPEASTDEMMGLVREEAVRVCAVILANLFPPYIREGLVDEPHGDGGSGEGNDRGGAGEGPRGDSEDRQVDADDVTDGGTSGGTIDGVDDVGTPDLGI